MTEFEQTVADWLAKQGWEVVKGGWPDFLAYKRPSVANGPRPKVVLIEAKQDAENLSKDQMRMHAALKAAGLPVYVLRKSQIFANWDAEEGLQLFSEGVVVAALEQIKEIEYRLLDLKRRSIELQHDVNHFRKRIQEAHIAFNLLDETSPPASPA